MTTAARCIQLAMKCTKCGDNFVPRKWNLSSRDYRCPPCKRKQQNAFNRTDPHFKAKHKAAYRRRKTYYVKYWADRKNDPDFILRKKARRKVSYAVETGKVKKPTLCQICKTRPALDAHHEDYSKPLDVRWFCRSCHITYEKENLRAKKK